MDLMVDGTLEQSKVLVVMSQNFDLYYLVLLTFILVQRSIVLAFELYIPFCIPTLIKLMDLAVKSAT